MVIEMPHFDLLKVLLAGTKRSAVIGTSALNIWISLLKCRRTNLKTADTRIETSMLKVSLNW